MNILEFAKTNLLYLDGGMGTLLQSAGLTPGESPERWNLTHPEVITGIHRDYFEAGSHVVNTNTFGANLLHFGETELKTIIAADISNAKANGMSPAMLDGLTLTEARIKAIAASVEKVIALPDPLAVSESRVRPNGLKIEKKRVPFGVIAIIYEARPNVTADAAALCVKSGNAVILRGGKEAINSNIAVANVLSDALAQSGLPKACVQIVSDTSRETANALMKMKGGIDLLIPRGGKNLIRSVVDNATVPVIETGAGNCHVYFDESADFETAINIIDNAKRSRPSVCNAAESLLVHESIAKDILPLVKARLDNV